MNKVSWKRILQRAGHESPGEDAMAMSLPNGSAKQRSAHGIPPVDEAGAGILESELQRALNRASRRDSGQAMGTPPGWEPIFQAQELAPPAVPQSNKSSMKTPPAAPPRKQSGSGARNMLAISLSAVVVGIAFHQISVQWSEQRSAEQGVAASEPEISSASMLYAAPGSVDAVMRASRDDAPSLGLRPSLTQDAPSLDSAQGSERDAFMKEVEQAASILDADRSEQARKRSAPVTPVSAPLPKISAEVEPVTVSGEEEQSMLLRARELMDRGEIAGARLIFEHLAQKRSALGAFALAQTYDEKFLTSISAKGMQPDQSLAAQWYRRAAELVAEAPPRP